MKDKMKDKIEKMIEILQKFARDGKSTPASQRLHNNLFQISKNIKHLDNDMFNKLTAKQSLESALVNSCKVIDQIKTIKSNKRAENKLKKLAQSQLPEKRILKGYYTDDIYQEWIDENDERFDIVIYEAYQKFVRKFRKY
jgi:hypothetical protein